MSKHHPLAITISSKALWLALGLQECVDGSKHRAERLSWNLTCVNVGPDKQDNSTVGNRLFVVCSTALMLKCTELLNKLTVEKL